MIAGGYWHHPMIVVPGRTISALDDIDVVWRSVLLVCAGISDSECSDYIKELGVHADVLDDDLVRYMLERGHLQLILASYRALGCARAGRA